MTCLLTRRPNIFVSSALIAVLVIGWSAYFSMPHGNGQTGQMEVSAYFPEGAGVVHPNSPVTDRGVTIGRVTAVAFTSVGVRLDLSIDDTAKIGLDATATLRPTDMPGENGGNDGRYDQNSRFSVDLDSDQPAGPYLGSGSVIPRGRTEAPPEQTLAGLLTAFETMSGVTRATT
jgi:phospholipid/cholesterol/gamma-HCH transport system substrate-binding protein